MARAKIPVDTPICDAAYLRRIDPIWVPGPVPHRFWHDRANRRDYLLWLAHKLRFRWMTDFYRLSFDSLRGKFPKGPTDRYWRASQVEAVRDCFPEYDWKEWLFTQVPARFWDSRVNCRKYLRWLAERLGFREMDDWHGVTSRDFRRNAGTTLLLKHGATVVLVLKQAFSQHNWQEWRFERTPRGFWDLPRNRHRYLRWLGRQLGFRRRQDWYRIRYDDIASHHGSALLARFPNIRVLMCDFMPQMDWDQLSRQRPISVEEVLSWADAYHARHGKWPNRNSGTIPGTIHTWQKVASFLSQGTHGLPRASLARLLTEHRGAPSYLGRPLSEDQILAWADAYFAAHGSWPAAHSLGGPVQGETWKAIESALKHGRRGLPGGSSLARLLTQRRGVQPRFGRLLSEKRILAWADTHFAVYGSWPIRGSSSGPPGDTWAAIDAALRKGGRGLPAGSSLPMLLKQHRGAGRRIGPPLSERRILAWADAYFATHRKWPTWVSPGGPVRCPSDTWRAIDAALRAGSRGLPGGSSLYQLLKKHGRKRHPRDNCVQEGKG